MHWSDPNRGLSLPKTRLVERSARLSDVQTLLGGCLRFVQIVGETRNARSFILRKSFHAQTQSTYRSMKWVHGDVPAINALFLSWQHHIARRRVSFKHCVKRMTLHCTPRLSKISHTTIPTFFVNVLCCSRNSKISRSKIHMGFAPSYPELGTICNCTQDRRQLRTICPTNVALSLAASIHVTCLTENCNLETPSSWLRRSSYDPNHRDAQERPTYCVSQNLRNIPTCAWSQHNK